jgi:AbrB family looped-hinge helix DNA binding protein
MNPLPGASMQNFCISAKLRHMKATVTITSRGVVTLPAKLRQALGLKADDQLIAETTPEGLLLRPAVTLPVELYTPEREREFDEAEAELAGVLTVAHRRPPSAAARRKPRRR